MEKKLPELKNLNSDNPIRTLRENVSLVFHEGKRFIVKGKRKKERNILERLRFLNEKRLYTTFTKGTFQYLNIPDSKVEENNQNLLLEYIEKGDNQVINLKNFVLSYQELQQINPSKNIFLDYYNQIFRGYFYRTNIVSLFTLRKKINVELVTKTLKLFFLLILKQQKFKKKYWVHGDLNNSNFFLSKTGQLYFIDFENMFYTRKWPLAEIFSKCFTFDNDDLELNFSPELLWIYLGEVEESSELTSIDLLLQCRFGLLLQCIREIAQTKIPKKKSSYLALLRICLSDNDFNNWYTENITDFTFNHLKAI